MTINIIPEKLAHIKKHKTRKNIINSTLASKDLINKASHLLYSVEIANKEFKKLNIPYLSDTKVVYYSPEKIILQSKKEILKSKVKELHGQFLEILNKRKFFSKIKKIEIIIDYEIEKQTKTRKHNYKAQEILREIKLELAKK